jgi:hypothetical protein
VGFEVAMSNWRATLAGGFELGTIASLPSTAALTLLGWLEERRPAAPNNGPSQWIWGESEAYEKRLTLRHTAVGYGVHHATSVFWAIVHVKLFGASDVPSLRRNLVAEGLVTAGLALLVDYTITPCRLRPGFDKHLSKPSVAIVYAAFGAGLAAAQLLRGPRARRRVF